MLVLLVISFAMPFVIPYSMPFEGGGDGQKLQVNLAEERLGLRVLVVGLPVVVVLLVVIVVVVLLLLLLPSPRSIGSWSARSQHVSHVVVSATGLRVTFGRCASRLRSSGESSSLA